MNEENKEIAQSRVRKTLLRIFTDKICNKLPLDDNEKAIVRNAQAIPEKNMYLQEICNCFFESDL